MKIIQLLLLIIGIYASAQIQISGNISSENSPVSGANITLVDTYDGATSDANGNFNFTTFEQGNFTLQIDKEGYSSYTEDINIENEPIFLNIILDKVVALDAIVYTAGQMSAKAESNNAILKPLDVVTTAGSMGDNIGALQTLPGTQNNAEDGRLFVRGGDPFETTTYVDGMKVYQPYTASTPNSPVRGRFSPFLFKGINFSTGGFGVKFGDAMSGVLDMNTTDMPKENLVELSFMTVGAGAGITRIGENKALSVNASYTNLALYNAVFKTRDEWLKSPESVAGEAVYRQKLGSGLWKTYVAYDVSTFKLRQFGVNYPEGRVVDLSNKNLYLNSTWNGKIAPKTELLIGGSFSDTNQDMTYQDDPIDNKSYGAFTRAEITGKWFRKLKITTGLTLDYQKDKNLFSDFQYDVQNTSFDTYADAEWSVTSRFGIKSGIRGTYSNLLNDWVLQPRINLAYRLTNTQNLALAMGRFAQMPNSLFWFAEEDLTFQKADQIMANYLLQTDKNIVRAEVYYKKYRDLITYNTTDSYNYENIGNHGFGDAKGFDFFWRNSNQLIKKLDFWITYSFVDSDRIYQDYPIEAQPNYVPNHSVSWVGKYWIQSLRSQLGLTYQFSSGRTYTNPNDGDFLGSKSHSFNSLNLGWSYLLAPQKIVYIGINNILNIKNTFGYEFSNTPNDQGFYDRDPIRVQNNQFFFVGFFWTISTDKTKNQLDNL